MKYLSIIKYVLLIVSAILVIAGAVTGKVDLMLGWSFAMILLTIALTIIMPLVAVFQNPKSATRSLIGLGVIVVVFLVSYALASDEPIKLASGKVMDNSFELKFSDTALYATYIAFAGVVLSILYGELYKVFKK
ncbi:hypothetical protein [uncultured Rikenella sp.]|uniref:hypothetical protein n=1 Tax=uncultured Rikenella sp. TaxID=368003 RepID=UPI00260DA586|nr:hypothetical protein [uncultured Rikenella sp.]